MLDNFPLPKDDLRTIDIKIDVNFGSNYQQEFNVKCLAAMLQAWLYSMRDAHQKNEAEAEMLFNQRKTGV